MINSIGPTGPGNVAATGAAGGSQGVQKAAPVAQKAKTDVAETVPNPAAELAASGPPVNTDKVAQVRAAIANGSYNIDIQAIANRMIADAFPAEG
jgi:negative regulator of flagellin synthesis FlgM